MKNKYKSILLFVAAFILLFLSGCKKEDFFEKNKKEGNVIRINYDSNGGTYLDREGITIIDLLNPSKYQADSNGVKHIKLLNPTDSRRKSGGSEGIYITKKDSFLVGWYKNRVIENNSNGKPINKNGEELVLINDTYYLASDNTIVSEPLYKYSGYWNFETDTIDYDSNMSEYSMTLYAVWSDYFEFNYYFEIDGEWVKSDTITSFDYATTNSINSKTFDKDTIWLPAYMDGAMNYTHNYEYSGKYEFPSIDGYSFKEAYLDKEKTKPINGSFKHQGSINYETGEAINPIQNIYITLDEGVKYYISTPQQLIDNANLNGIYYIENDLDFEGYEWPQLFNVGVFKGKFISKSGDNVTIRNVKVVHNSENSKIGGIFGQIDANAEISNITFENATLDLSYVGRRNRDTSFGLFAGIVDDKAIINNVNISGCLRIGNVTLGDNYQIGLISGNNTNKVKSLSNIELVVYGTKHGNEFKYTINPDSIKVEDNMVIVEPVASLNKDKDSYIINYREEN